MKRMISVTLALVCLFALASCSKSTLTDRSGKTVSGTVVAVDGKLIAVMIGDSFDPGAMSDRDAPPDAIPGSQGKEPPAMPDDTGLYIENGRPDAQADPPGGPEGMPQAPGGMMPGGDAEYAILDVSGISGVDIRTGDRITAVIGKNNKVTSVTVN